MVAAMAGNWIMGDFVRALGLPPDINLVQIHIGLNNPVTILTRAPLASDAADTVLQCVQTYHCTSPDSPGALTGMHIGKAIHDALALPPETNMIQIRVAMDEVVEVLVRYYPNREAMARCQAVLAAYRATPVGERSVIDDLREPLEPGAAHSAEHPQQAWWKRLPTSWWRSAR